MYTLIVSPFGDIIVFWEKPSVGSALIRRIFLPGEDKGKGKAKSFGPPPPGPAGQVCEKIQVYLGGAATEFSREGLDIDSLGGFQRRVLLQTMLIPRGKVVSYGALAEKLGVPGAARAVGTALAKNPFPLIIPCHRVVRANGDPGRFGGGRKLKRDLLEMEGVVFDHRGRIRG